MENLPNLIHYYCKLNIFLEYELSINDLCLSAVYYSFSKAFNKTVSDRYNDPEALLTS